LEKGYGRKISSLEDFENLLGSIGVDTTSIPKEEMYLAFQANNPTS